MSMYGARVTCWCICITTLQSDTILGTHRPLQLLLTSATRGISRLELYEQSSLLLHNEVSEVAAGVDEIIEEKDCALTVHSPARRLVEVQERQGVASAAGANLLIITAHIPSILEQIFRPSPKQPLSL